MKKGQGIPAACVIALITIPGGVPERLYVP